MVFWSCAQTHPQREALALRNLRRQKFTAFYPFFLVPARYGRQRVQPVFPSYIFVQLDEETHWSPINSTLGVRRLLTLIPRDEDAYLQPCRIGFIEALRRLRFRRPEAPDADTAIDDEPIPLGTMVQIERGPFVGRQALVDMADAQRVRLLLECFGGRQMHVHFDVSDVTCVAAPLPIAV